MATSVKHGPLFTFLLLLGALFVVSNPALAAAPVIVHRPASIQPTTTTRIINGTIVDSANSYPFYVAVLRQGSDIVCGGTLVGPNTVVSAAHCFYSIAPCPGSPCSAISIESCTPADMCASPATDRTHVAVGLRHLTKKSKDVEIVPILETEIHDNFHMEHVEKGGDIAVITLATPISLEHQSKMALVNDDKLYPKSEDRVTVIGFGRRTNLAYASSADLRELHQEIVSDDECQEDFHKAGTNVGKKGTFICAQKPGEVLAGVCNGDSGGPLVTQDKDNQFSLVGVVSRGIGICGYPGFPDIYTRVSHYHDFISGILERNNERMRPSPSAAPLPPPPPPSADDGGVFQRVDEMRMETMVAVQRSAVLLRDWISKLSPNRKRDGPVSTAPSPPVAEPSNPPLLEQPSSSAPEDDSSPSSAQGQPGPSPDHSIQPSLTPSVDPWLSPEPSIASGIQLEGDHDEQQTSRRKLSDNADITDTTYLGSPPTRPLVSLRSAVDGAAPLLRDEQQEAAEVLAGLIGQAGEQPVEPAAAAVPIPDKRLAQEEPVQDPATAPFPDEASGPGPGVSAPGATAETGIPAGQDAPEVVPVPEGVAAHHR